MLTLTQCAPNPDGYFHQGRGLDAQSLSLCKCMACCPMFIALLVAFGYSSQATCSLAWHYLTLVVVEMKNKLGLCWATLELGWVWFWVGLGLWLWLGWGWGLGWVGVELGLGLVEN